MTKGGYQIINLNNTEFKLHIPMVISGIYEKIEGTHKPILLSGLVINDVEYHDIYVAPKVYGSSFVISAYGYIIYISDIDIVTISEYDTLEINAKFIATNSFVETDIDTYNSLNNIDYNSVPNRVRVIYAGNEYSSVVTEFDGNNITILINNTFCKLETRQVGDRYEIKLEVA